jgi:UDP-N-acetylglucosamine/UDP-N-acetylgalactosamine diphosphorylase
MSTNMTGKLEAAGQSRLAKALMSLSGKSKERLERQLEQIDWDELPRLIKDYVLKKPETTIPSDLSPAPFFPLKPRDAKEGEHYKMALAEGRRLLSSGKVAALTVAGGQGTRLGFDGPKGTFPISPVKHKTLFQIFAEGLKRNSEKYGARIQWFIMTSELNDATTREFFKSNSFFGLPSNSVSFFTQGTMPAIAYDGSLLLAEPDSLALAPNGHGGTLLALRKSGALDLMSKLGVEHISYFQVDNPLVPVVDPFFIGLHSLEKAEISAIMLPKTNPYEKLGNFCLSKGRLEIIEYSDMPKDLAEKRNHDGSLAFIAGSPAIHVISRAFVERLTKDGRLDMPWHRADKKVAFIDDSGKAVSPEKPNAVKLESFIFDALPLATKTMVIEGRREELFAPTKNPTGVDSVESCRAMMVARDARRLELAGAKVPRKSDGFPDCLVEISPLLAFDDEDAASVLKAKGISSPKPGSENYYG